MNGNMVKITSHPSLGQDMIVSREQASVYFTVLIEHEEAKQPSEVELWHNLHDEHGWEALPLEAGEQPTLDLVQTGSLSQRSWFTGHLEGKPSSLRPVLFTIRFRSHPDLQFRWAKDESAIEDGRLLYQWRHTRMEVSSLFQGISSCLVVESVSSDTAETQVWSISGEVPASSGEEPGRITHDLGRPLHVARWFALTRLSGPWLGPRHGKDFPLAEDDVVLYCFLRTDGLHVAVLAISGVGDMVTLLCERGKALAAHTKNDSDEKGVTRIAVAVGTSLEEAIAAAVYHARALIDQACPVTLEQVELLNSVNLAVKAGINDTFQAKWQQDWTDGFTYCTWNGLGQNLSSTKILSALEALKTNSVEITNLIIDDNWQSLENTGESPMRRAWTNFEANSPGFPGGLTKTIAEIREKFPNIKHIAVWHALLGYWGGVSPRGQIAHNYSVTKLTKPDSELIHAVDDQNISRMFNEFYAFLSQAGVDSVKTDVQCYLEDLGPTTVRRKLTNAYYSSWLTAQLRHFSGRAISCMSQSPTILFRCQLPRSLPALTVRNSDDFFPDIRASHPWHIFCNAHNSLLTSMLNVLPDWDMFQTGHEWAPFHAAARCVSGGPVYITDVPGEHNVILIEEMTATTPRGQRIILRCSCVGKSLRAYSAFEEEKLCAVGTYHGAKKTGAGIIGLFNCLDTEITDILGLEMFRGIESDTEYMLRSHKSGQISEVTWKGAPNSIMALSFKNFGWDIVTAVPVTEMTSNGQSGAIKIANFGLLGKMSGIAALLGNKIQMEHSMRRLRIETRLKALGTLGLWISSLKTAENRQKTDLEDDLMVTIRDRVIPWNCVGISHRSEQGAMLKVDVARAWKALDMSAGWSNEVEVIVFLNVHRTNSRDRAHHEQWP